MKSIFPYNENSAALKSCGAIIVLNDQRLIPILNVEQLCWVGNYFLITRLTSREMMVLLLCIYPLFALVFPLLID